MILELWRRIVLEALLQGELVFTVHALKQMSSRGLGLEDLASIARTCVDFWWQPEKQTYLVIGRDSRSKGAAVACKLDQGVVVVTVMRRHLTRAERERSN
jgi:hypothetical protein